MTTEEPNVFTSQRLTRRSAVRAGGAGAAAVLAGGDDERRVGAGCHSNAGHGEGGVMRPLLSDNPMWEAFGNRALVLAIDRGADFGECVTTVRACRRRQR